MHPPPDVGECGGIGVDVARACSALEDEGGRGRVEGGGEGSRRAVSPAPVERRCAV